MSSVWTPTVEVCWGVEQLWLTDLAGFCSRLLEVGWRYWWRGNKSVDSSFPVFSLCFGCSACVLIPAFNLSHKTVLTASRTTFCFLFVKTKSDVDIMRRWSFLYDIMKGNSICIPFNMLGKLANWTWNQVIEMTTASNLCTTNSWLRPLGNAPHGSVTGGAEPLVTGINSEVKVANCGCCSGGLRSQWR